MKLKTTIVCLIIFTTCLTGCNFGAGTHGSLKGYRYPTTKDKLESAVMSVIDNNDKIYRNSNNANHNMNQTNGQNDSLIDNSYNDGTNYLTIKIKTDKGQNEYTFRYYGDEKYWKTSKTSEIFICYAFDEYGQGGSEGNGGVSRKKLKYLTEVFEKELISKIDKKLNLTYTETE